jgi:hypothetical protein
MNPAANANDGKEVNDMTYEKPDLEFVGSASTVVLGDKSGTHDATDDPNSPNVLALGLDE